jgi:hypothetical protein
MAHFPMNTGAEIVAHSVDRKTAGSCYRSSSQLSSSGLLGLSSSVGHHHPDGIVGGSLFLQNFKKRQLTHTKNHCGVDFSLLISWSRDNKNATKLSIEEILNAFA